MHEAHNMFTLIFYLTLLRAIPSNTEMMITHLLFSLPYISACIYVCIYVCVYYDTQILVLAFLLQT